MTKKFIAASTLAFLLSAGAAFAQTYPTGSGTTSTGTTGTGTTGATGTVGIPNTGAGGNAAEAVAILGTSALVAVGAATALMRRRIA